MVSKIKELCSDKGLTVWSLEKKAGLSEGAISKWEKSSPSVSKLLSVCAVLGVPLSAVVDDPYAAPASPARGGGPLAVERLSPALQDNEKKLLDSFYQLNRQGQTKLFDYLDFLLSKPENIQKETASSSRLIG